MVPDNYVIRGQLSHNFIASRLSSLVSSCGVMHRSWGSRAGAYAMGWNMQGWDVPLGRIGWSLYVLEVVVVVAAHTQWPFTMDNIGPHVSFHMY